MEKLVLYGALESVYVQVIRILLRKKALLPGGDYTMVEFDVFDPDTHPLAFIENSPFRKIPILCHGDCFLYETSAIARYLDSVYAPPHHMPLVPNSALEQARMNQIIAIVDHYAYPSMVTGLFVEYQRPIDEGVEPDFEHIRRSGPKALRCIDEIEKLMGCGDCLIGDQFTLADCYLMPVINYFLKTREGQDWECASMSSPLIRWWHRVRDDPTLMDPA